MLGQPVVHARQHVGTRVGGALAHQEVPVVPQQLLGVPPAHLAVVPGLAPQLLLAPGGHGARQQGAAVVHRGGLVERRGGAAGRGQRLARPGVAGRRLGVDGVLEGLWYGTGIGSEGTSVSCLRF